MADATSPRRIFETRLAELVEKFERHRGTYVRADYPESQARLDFVDPLFEALGWDVRNEAGLGPAEREVVVEQGETAGRPDYNFRLDGHTVFFVEAKAPHVSLERTDVVMQAKQYAWNSKDVFVAAVTDFEEFRLYDATVKPDRKHPNVGLIFAHRYGDYLKPKVLDDLWLLSKESVAAGSIDQLLEMSSVKRRQRMPVDEAFLDDLSGWREQLAKAVYKTHPDLAVADLNSVVQVFLDRLVFIRIAEDRGILKPRGLEDIARLWEHSGKRRSIVADLNALFHEVNALLNGEIFKPHPCEKIDWDASADLVVKIVRGLYDGPYKFDYIGVELLGSIYERYLGKTIRVTATRAIVEDKPEVRKAGGVYYTPKYIVDYIVDQTVGRLIEGKTPAQIAKLRILDPACGSGSFLLGAYQKLLSYHQRYKAEHRAKKRKTPAQPELIGAGDGGEVRLTLEEKAVILSNNLYGVDIDPQAVEITMMSLYIKMLEGERGLIAGRGVLPPLKDNIKCGNSLIGHDIRDVPDITDEDLDRINPFDWNSRREGFGEIMAGGGFDAVIGNPPYVLLQSLGLPSVQKYLVNRYNSARYKVDTYQVLIEQACLLSKQRGFVSFITPNTFLRNKYAIALRELLLENTEIIHLRLYDYRVFAGASVDTVITVLRRTDRPNPAHKVSIDRAISPADIQAAGEISQVKWSARSDKNFDLPGSQAGRQLIEKIDACATPLGNFATAYFGIQTHSREKYVQPYPSGSGWKPVLDGGNISRYFLMPPVEYVSTEPRAIKSGGDSTVYERERIGVRQIGKRPIATLLPGGWYSLNTIYNIFFTRNVDYSLKFILGLMLSSLFGWYWEQRFFDQKQTFPKVKKAPLLSLPIRNIDFNNPTDRTRHDKMVSLVQRMLDLYKQKQSATSDAARARLEREINVTDEQIDKVVYELYGLTEEEIKIVEDAR